MRYGPSFTCRKPDFLVKMAIENASNKGNQNVLERKIRSCLTLLIYAI